MTKKTTPKPIRWFIRLAVLIMAMLLIFGVWLPMSGTLAQGGPTPTAPAGTRIPPTKVPAPAATPTPDAIAMSGIASIQESGVIRVGTAFNAPPFSWLDENGDVVGYEPEVMRAIAVDLGVDVEFVQVTAETARPLLLSGEVDMLIGQQLHSRDREAYMSFSHVYYTNFQKLVVQTESPYGSLADFANRPVSVVVGSRGEQALNTFIAEQGIAVDIRRFLTESEALDALQNGEVEGMAGEFDDLRRAGRQGMRFIDDHLRIDPYAIAFRRFDINLRNAVDRALQRLAASGRMDEIAENWFDPDERAVGTNFAALIPVYLDFATDERTIDEFPPDVPQPQRTILDKIREGQALNVAGLSLDTSTPSYQRFLDSLNREIIREMARRWGVEVIFLPGTFGQGQDRIVSGEADLAVGVRPRWDGVDRVDYSLPYLHRQDTVITYDGSRYRFFNDFRGGSWIGFYSDDPADGERVQELADFFNVRPAIFTFISNQQVYDEMIGTRNVDGLYGDSIRLQDFILNNTPDLWRFIESRDGGIFTDNFEPITLAVPRNDADFLSLVNWTLGDMYSDGTLQRLWGEYYPGFGRDGFSAGPPFIPDWPGDGTFLYDKIRS